MITSREAISAFYGSCRLARLDPNGLSFFDLSAAGALRSLWILCAIIPLEIFIGLSVSSTAKSISFIPASFAVLMAGRLYFLVISYYYARYFTKDMSNYTSMVAVKNWSEILIFLVTCSLLMVASTGALPDSFLSLLGLMVLVMIMVYQWFIFRLTLKCDEFASAGLVLIDLIFLFLVSNVQSALN